MKSKLDRIAIGSCASDTADANAAVGPRYVFDDNWLAKRCSHPLGHETPPYVGRTACADRHDHVADAMLVTTSPFFITRAGQIAALAARQRIPVIYARREFADAGGLM